MYMESNEYTSCSSGCHSLIVLIKAIVGVGIELYLNIQCFRILSHTNNVTERHFEHDLRSIKQNRFAFLVFVGGCEFKRCESIPMCLTRTEMCPKTIGCSDDAFLRCAWVCDWLPALCFLTSHADGTDTYFTPISPCAQLPQPPGWPSEWALASCISKLSINLERCMENDAPRWKILFSVKLIGSWECRNVLGGDRVEPPPPSM